MKNWVQEGNTVTFIAPPGGAVSGIPLLVGSLPVIPAFSAAVGDECEGVTQGVFNLPKHTTDTPDQFDKAYWDATNSRVTTEASGNTVIGVFMHALVAGTDIADIRLNGVAV